jgi:cell division protein FtsN
VSLLYTILLVLKSLFPFLKEIVLRDKGVRELLLSNKAATGLAACLLVMFVLFYYVKVVADLTHVRNTKLTTELVELKKTNSDQLELIGVLEGRLKARPMKPAPTTPNPSPPERPTAAQPPKQKGKPSLRDYAIGKLKAID